MRERKNEEERKEKRNYDQQEDKRKKEHIIYEVRLRYMSIEEK
jgi:hypothetical protein